MTGKWGERGRMMCSVGATGQKWSLGCCGELSGSPNSPEVRPNLVTTSQHQIWHLILHFFFYCILKDTTSHRGCVKVRSLCNIVICQQAAAEFAPRLLGEADKTSPSVSPFMSLWHKTSNEFLTEITAHVTSYVWDPIPESWHEITSYFILYNVTICVSDTDYFWGCLDPF